MKYGTAVSIMEKEGRRRNAPVYSISGMKTSFQKLVFVVLSARTKDKTTYTASKRLFKKADTPEKTAGLGEKEIEKLIYGVGFYKTKAKKIAKMSRILVCEYKGRVPESITELIRLPGVGRKTANVVLNWAFGKNSIAVDTHVHRISNRLGWVSTKKPSETEEELKKKIPEKLWKKLNKSMVGYGQTVCVPVSPFCSVCRIKRYCKRINVKKSR
ncbi:endonuclease III [Candidatus Micrarchaeota archaeon]|nr:endonuclease III [Candidatus Micrarchaeota archaeon]